MPAPSGTLEGDEGPRKHRRPQPDQRHSRRSEFLLHHYANPVVLACSRIYRSMKTYPTKNTRQRRQTSRLTPRAHKEVWTLAVRTISSAMRPKVWTCLMRICIAETKLAPQASLARAQKSNGCVQSH